MYLLSACNKSGTDENTIITPSDLTINSSVAVDGSGFVSFTASATNAVNYFYDFGNGATTSTTNGNTSYTYPEEGKLDYTVVVTAVSNTGQSIKKSVSITVTKVLALFWSDEFEADGPPDPKNWGYDLGGGGWGNNELEFYTNRSENAIVHGGFLHINAIKENYQGAQYTSARLLTKDKISFTYGKVDVRAKLPKGGGTWPAIWMLGSNIGSVSWPACGEIDIMEHLGNDTNKIYGTLHYPGRSGGNANGSSIIIPNATSEFHTYSVLWYPNAIKILVDEQLYHTVVNATALPFNHDFFLILNIAMGGNFGGTIDPAFTQASMDIDYVRVYK
jgi:beta-glucanase (GH16 family)